MSRPLSVFVSSTSEDLRDHRTAVRDALLELGLFPIVMEQFPAQDAIAVRACQRYIAEADILVGIYAHRYGWVPTLAQGGDGKSSITALEYQWAGERPIPRLCFRIDPDHPWPPPLIEGEPGKSALARFKAQINDETIRGTFTTPENLAGQVKSALFHEVQRVKDHVPALEGWRRLTAPLLAHGFVGRADDLRAVSDLLAEDGPPVVLVGTGGLGKTALARHLARTCSEDFPGGVLWASLGPEARHTQAVLPPILQAWAQAHPQGRRMDPTTLTPDVLRGLLGQAPGRLLAVLDDAWFPGPVRELLTALPEGAACLVTTRSPQVAALGRPVPLYKLPLDDGYALLLDRLDAAGIAAADYADPLRAIVRQLDGHALALDLAARQIVERGIAFAPTLVTRLRRYLDGATPFKLLQLGESTEREDSLEAALFLSYDPLDADTQTKFRALGVLAPDASFAAGTAFATWGIEPDDEAALEAAEDALAALVRAGLVAREPETGRYTQHLLLHAYARALAYRAGEHDPALGRYTWHVVNDIAGQFEALPMEQWDAVLGPDLPHVHHVGNALAGYLQAIVFGEIPLDALAQPDPPDDLPDIDPDDRMAHALLERGEAFAGKVTQYTHWRRIGDEGRRWLQLGLACARLNGNHEHESLFLNELGLWHMIRGYSNTALDLYQQSLDIRRAVGDRTGEGVTLNNLAAVYDNLGQYERALDLYQQALDIRREVGDRAGEDTILNNIALVHKTLGQYERALDLYQQALDISREVGNRAGEGTTFNNMAGVHKTLGQYKRALDLYQQALDISREVGNRAGEGTTLNNIAGVYNSLGQYKHGLDFYQQALDILREVGDRPGEAVICYNIGKLLHDAFGQTASAIPYLERCVAIEEEIGHPDLESDRALLAKLRRSLNDPPPAE